MKKLQLLLSVVVTAVIVSPHGGDLAGSIAPGASAAGEATAAKKGKKKGKKGVPLAQNARRLGGKPARRYRERCSPDSVKIGTVCMMSNPYPLTNPQLGVSDYFFATQRCAELGGYLPTAAQLIGAAPYVKLAGRLDDNEVTASTDIDPSDGLKDRREMSATLTTTASGGRAAGSVGVSPGSTGNPNAGEPNPTPVPANPSPETLQYITVFDNGDRGGFGGGEPVGQPGIFRCAFNVAQVPGGLPEEKEDGNGKAGGS